MNLSAPTFRIPFNPITQNPRAVRFCYATGRAFSAREFVPWMARCWIEFCREHEVKNEDAARAKFQLDLHRVFDAWHDEAVASGRFSGVGAVAGADA